MTGLSITAGLSPSMQALVLLAIVLAEATLLYVGYGLLEDALAPTIFNRLRDI